jgi:hypothetical protein
MRTDNVRDNTRRLTAPRQDLSVDAIAAQARANSLMARGLSAELDDRLQRLRDTETIETVEADMRRFADARRQERPSLTLAQAMDLAQQDPSLWARHCAATARAQGTRYET